MPHRHRAIPSYAITSSCTPLYPHPILTPTPPLLSAPPPLHVLPLGTPRVRYGNQRVIVLDATSGEFKRQWGAYGHDIADGSADTTQQFGRTVHGISLSHDGAPPPLPNHLAYRKATRGRSAAAEQTPAAPTQPTRPYLPPRHRTLLSRPAVRWRPRRETAAGLPPRLLAARLLASPPLACCYTPHPVAPPSPLRPLLFARKSAPSLLLSRGVHLTGLPARRHVR